MYIKFQQDEHQHQHTKYNIHVPSFTRSFIRLFRIQATLYVCTFGVNVRSCWNNFNIVWGHGSIY